MTLSSENDVALADLRLLLPLRAGDEILLGSECPYLEHELDQLKVRHTRIADLGSSQAERPSVQKFQHAIFPALPLPDVEASLEYIRQRLDHQATLLFGTANPLYWLRKIAKHKVSTSSLHPQQGHVICQNQNFKVVRLFGNPDSLDNPRYLIDLETPEPTEHFIHHVQIPYSIKGEALRLLSHTWMKVRSYNTIFPSLLWQVVHNR
jgi:hypothetical protein